MQQPINGTEFEHPEEISAGELFYKVLPFWPYFIILLLMTFSGAWLYLRYKIPIYRTTASLLIKDDKKGADSKDIMEALDIFGSKKTVENEVEILKSKTLIWEVVKSLHLYAPVIIE